MVKVDDAVLGSFDRITTSTGWIMIVIIIIIIIIIIMMMMMMMMIMIIALKAPNSIFLQYFHCAANCPHHVRSSDPGAIVCKSRSINRALITCKLQCATWYEGTAQLLSLTTNNKQQTNKSNNNKPSKPNQTNKQKKKQKQNKNTNKQK